MAPTNPTVDQSGSSPPEWYFDTAEELEKNTSRLFLVLLSISSYFAIALLGLDDLQLILPSARIELPLLRISVSTYAFFLGGHVLLIAAMLYCYLSLDRLETLVTHHRSYWQMNPLRLYRWLISARLSRRESDAFSRVTFTLVSVLLYFFPLLTLVGLTLFSVKAHRVAFSTLLAVLSVVGIAIVLLFTRRSRERLHGRMSRRRNALELGTLAACAILLLTLVWVAPSKNTRLLNIWLHDRVIVTAELLKASEADPTIQFPSDLHLEFANLSGATLPGVRMIRARLDGANLWFARLSDAYLVASHLTGAGLVDADLTNAHLAYVEARGTNFAGADLTGANLGSARLQGANFKNANLTRANLHGADLSGADFGKIEYGDRDELTSALVPNYYDSRATLVQARISVHTILPDGKNLRESLFPWKEWGMVVVNREGYVLDPQPPQFQGDE